MTPRVKPTRHLHHVAHHRGSRAKTGAWLPASLQTPRQSRARDGRLHAPMACAVGGMEDPGGRGREERRQPSILRPALASPRIHKT